MSEHAHAHADAHAEGEPHVLPVKTYLATWITLMVLTAITVAASYVHFGSWNLIIAMVVATVKAVVVSLIFMHLFWDHKFHAIIFGFSIIFLAIFIGFTLSDTAARGRADSIEGDRPRDISQPFAGTKGDDALKLKYGAVKPKPAAPSSH